MSSGSSKSVWENNLTADEQVSSSPRALAKPRRPLPLVVCAGAAGIFAALSLDRSFSPVVFLSIALVALAGAVLIRREVLSNILLLVAIAGAGGAWAAVRGPAVSDDETPWLSRPRQYLDVTGVIATSPWMSEQKENGGVTWCFEVVSDTVRWRGGEQEWPGRLMVFLRAEEDSLLPAYGQRWRWRGAVRVDEPVELRRRGLAGIMTVDAHGASMLAAQAGHPFVAWCYQQREKAAALLGAGLSSADSSVALTRALLLGLREEIDPAVRDAFARTGTLHILALSGMHVAILVLLLVIVLKSAGIQRPHWILVMLPFLATYTIATGATASMIRASIMAVVYFSAYTWRKKPDGPSSLAFSALLILLFDPRQLFDSGFILSFVAVGGLIALVPPVSALLKRRVVTGDPWAEPEMSWWSSGARLGWDRILDLFAVSLVAWLVSLPVIIAMFNMLSPSALLVNIPLVPLSFLILLTACLSVLGGFIALPLAEIFNHANNLFSALLLGAVDVTSTWPGAYVYVAAWPGLLAGLWFVLLAAWIPARGWWRAGITAMLLAMIGWSVFQRHGSTRAEAVVLPAGDAAALLVDGPGNQAVLIDAGDAFYQRDVIKALRQRGINRLDAVWITRARTDAYGGLPALVHAMPVDAVWVPDAPASQTYFHQTMDAARAFLPDGVMRTWPEDPAVEVGDVLYRRLFPASVSDYQNAVDSSLVLHISRGTKSILFMGQCSASMVDAASLLPVDYVADGLAVGLVERSADVPGHWIDLVRPGLIVFSPRGFERTPDSLDALLSRLPPVLLLEPNQPVVRTL